MSITLNCITLNKVLHYIKLHFLNKKNPYSIGQILFLIYANYVFFFDSLRLRK